VGADSLMPSSLPSLFIQFDKSVVDQLITIGLTMLQSLQETSGLPAKERAKISGAPER